MRLTYMVQLELISCYLCGVEFGMTAEMTNQRREDHRNFYCPNGHDQRYLGETEAEKQRKRAERLERQLANKDEDLRSTRASLTATKGQLTKTKKRVANGVCPCCNRSFADLGRHMAGQHPNYAEASTS